MYQLRIVANQAKRMGRVLFIVFLASLGLSVLAAPLLLYVSVFGPNLSNVHARWSEFGSAMGGIYSPILALLATAILVLQVLVQRAQAKHQFDHTFLSQSNADLEFYVVRLVQALDVKLSYGNTTRELLHAHYQPADIKQRVFAWRTRRAGVGH